MEAWLLEKIVLAPPLLFSLAIHEYAHGRTALAFGDPTAKLMGRVSLNPLRHLDPIGTIALFTVRFGWAKPVPVNPANLHPRRLGNILVSLAGPMSNLQLAVICGLILKALIVWNVALSADLPVSIVEILWLTMSINLVLCVFNLVPLYPLDGHHILGELLPPSKHMIYMQWQMQFGRLILMGLIFVPMLLNRPGPLSYLYRSVIDPAINWALGSA